jgi:L-lactate dehydrogenase complex protein LldG
MVGKGREAKTMSEVEKQEQFLKNLAKRLGRQRRSGVKPPNWGSQPYLHLYEDKAKEDLIQEFIANLAQLNTQVDRVSRSEWKSALANVLEKFGVKSAVYWNDPYLHELDLSAAFSEMQISSYEWDVRADKTEMKEKAATVDLGVACADLGLAETGSVVLNNGGGRGRVISLLPPAFLCILREDQIVPRLTHAVQLIHQQVVGGLPLPACINFITGPSRTGDIEMDLAFGVHGPGKVHIILLKD